MLAEETNITETAAAFGVSLRTLRFYEQIGLIHPTRVGTLRIYRAEDRIRIELVLKGRRLGFSLAQIRQIIDSRSGTGMSSTQAEPTGSLVERLTRDEVQQQLQSLERQRQELQEAIDALQQAAETKLDVDL